MKSVARMSQPELAAYVQAHLLKSGITVVLSGGAAVSIYTHDRYLSRDIDLVNVYSVPRNRLREAMQSFGFNEESRYFVHPSSPWLVEFPPGPLAIGDQEITGFSKLRYATGTLRVITSTDCVKDRLAAFYFFKDAQGLVQAVMVAKARRVHMSEIRSWSRSAGMMDQHRIFVRELASKSRRN